jgi:serine/threonine protein phosphatase PrpC
MGTGFPESTPTPVFRDAGWRRFWPRCRRGGLEAAFASETGVVHDANEDCCIHAPSAEAPVFCAVADGVGGGAHGDVASHALIGHCAAAPRKIYRDPEKIVEWLRRGDAVVRTAIARRTDRPGASTLAAAWFLSAGRAHLVHVGDCRAYRLRPRRGGSYRIEPLTADQTYANLSQPPPAGAGPDDPARMVGVGAVGTPPVRRVDLREGELLLLCSDGLHKFVSDDALAALAGSELRSGADLKQVCRSLARAARQNGSHDDVSVLLVRRRPGFGAAAKYWLALALTLVAALAVWACSRDGGLFSSR